MCLGWGIRASSKSLQRSANPSSASFPLRSKAISGHSVSRAPTSLRLIHYERPTAKPKSSQLGRRCALAVAAFTSIGLGYLGYGIYSHRNPPEQREPDPTKKTLVILGTGWGSVSLLKNLDTDRYNVIVVSPRNYFLFTPLLPSCTTGTIEHRSIMEPIRNFLRHKTTAVKFYEAECTKIDHERKIVHIEDRSENRGPAFATQVPFDYLVVGVGAESATFGVPGVSQHGSFLKEVRDAQTIRRRIMDCVETAAFKGQSPEEIKRLLHMVVVGGGPTGVEFAAELQDFFESDLRKWIPEIRDHFRVTLIEALPSVLPMFSKTLVDYTERTFEEGSIDIRTKTAVKEVGPTTIKAEYTDPVKGRIAEDIPYGLLVWATGNTARPLVRELMDRIPAQAGSRRGLAVNEYLAVKGVDDIWAIGDCAWANCAPTAQVAAQQGAFLAKIFDKRHNEMEVKRQLDILSKEHSQDDGAGRPRIAANIKDLHKRLRNLKQVAPFEYSHQGSLAYIGSDKAVAEITWFTGSNIAIGGPVTYLFWRSVYLNMCFSTRNRMLVATDWLKSYVFGRDVSRE